MRELQDRIEQLKGQIQRLSDQQAVIMGEKSTLEMINTQLRQVNKDGKQLEERLVKWRKYAKGLEGDNEKLKAKNEKLQRGGGGGRKQKEKLKQYEQDLAELQDSLSSYQEHYPKVLRKNKELGAEVRRLSGLVETAKEKNQTLRDAFADERSDLRDDRRKAEKRGDELDEELRQFKKRHESLESTFDHTIKEKEGLEDELSNARQENTKWETKNASLEADINELKGKLETDINELKGKLTNVQGNLRITNGQLSRTTDERNEWQRKYKTLMNTTQVTEAKLERQILELNTAAEEKEKKVKEMEDENETQGDEIEQLTDDNAELQQKNKELENVSIGEKEVFFCFLAAATCDLNDCPCPVHHTESRAIGAHL